jgi:putative transposase
VTRGGYYAWKRRESSKRALDNEALLTRIIEVHKASRETYGYPRVHAELRRQGEQCGRNRVARLMCDYGIKARMARRFRKHSHLHHLVKDSRNLLLAKEPVSRANEVWVCDVTYIRVGDDWNFLCAVMDLFTRKVIGWHFGKSVNAILAKEALLMALADNKPTAGLIFHTDQGTEFANKELTELLEQNGLQISKSRKGCCWDNANMESFFHTLKTEMVYFHRFSSMEEAIAHIMDYMRFYNHERLHSGLNYTTPVGYEAMAA